MPPHRIPQTRLLLMSCQSSRVCVQLINKITPIDLFTPEKPTHSVQFALVHSTVEKEVNGQTTEDPTNITPSLAFGVGQK